MRQNGTKPIEGGAYGAGPHQGQQTYGGQPQQFQGGAPQGGYQGQPQPQYPPQQYPQQQYPQQQPGGPYGYPQQTPPAKKKMALWKKILIGVGVLILVGGIAGVASGGKKGDTQDSKQTAVVDDTKSAKDDATTPETPAEPAEQQQQEEPPAETPAAPAEEPAALTIGSTTTIDGVDVTLSAAMLSRGQDFAQPGAGNLYLGLVVDVANNSQKSINISSMVNFEAYCDDYAIQPSLTAYAAPEWSGLSTLDGEAAAGKRLNGVIAYEVPENFTKFEISIKPDTWSSQTAQFVFDRAAVDASAIQG